MTDEVDVEEFLSGNGFPEDESSDNPAVAAVRKKIRELGKELKAKQAVISQYEEEKQKREISGVWEELKVPAEVRSLYRGEETTEAIKSWWDAGKGLFNISGSGDAPAGNESNEDLEQLREFSRGTAIGGDGNSDGSAAFLTKARELRNQSAQKNPDALDKLWELRP